MKRLCLTLLASALFAVTSSSAQETVANYTFPAAGDFTNSATSLLATASNVTNPAGGSITSTGLHYFRNNTNNAIPESLDAALANNTYIGFTVTPGAWPLDYRTFAFDFGLTNNTGTVATYTGNWAIFSSATGFNSSAELIATGSGDRAASTGIGAFWISPSPTIDLSAVEPLQNAEGPVEFRIYLWDNAVTSTSNLIIRLDNVSLTVANDPVAIATPPTPQTVTETGSVSFTVETTGSAPISYQWKRNDADLANDARISGATSANLTITGVTAADAGDYTVTVSNFNNSVTSIAAALTVNPLPVDLPDAPTANAALLVSDIGFIANWSSVSEALSYVLDVSTDSNFGSFLTGFQGRDVGDRLDFAVTDLTPSTPYYYRVRAINNVGSSVNSNTVTVTTTAPNLPPTITAIGDQAVAVNRSTGALAFTVGDSTTPATDLVVTATSGNPTLVPNTPAALALSGTAAARTLTITPAADQTGVALITVTVNDGARTTSTSFTLTVNPGNPWPEITSTNSTTFTIGLANRFQVTATGTPTPTFSATGLPAWATLNANTGVLTGAPPAGTTAGNLTLTITASNGVPPAATQTFTLTVSAIPTIAAPMSVTTLAGTAGQSGSTNATGAAARFNFPLGVAVDASGNSYIADESNHVIRKITNAGVVTTLAGTAGQSGSDDGTGSAARFNSPSGLAIDATGNLYVADTMNHTIRRITPAGEVTTIAGSAGDAGSLNGTGNASRFNAPQGVAVNATNLFIADTGNHTVRRVVLATGVVTTLAGTAGQSGSADGAGAAARFNSPTGIAADAANRTWVADAGNNTIRAVSAAGTVTTLAGLAGTQGAADGTGSAARFNEASALAFHTAPGVADLYLLDTENHTVRKIATATGVVTTMAGLPGTPGSTDGDGSTARFRFPAGIAVSSTGSAYIADTANHTVRLGLLPLAPTIATQPVSRSASIGAQVEFTVVATGRPTPSYQWQQNGVDIPGATSATYSIASVQGLHGGRYNVIVTNALGSAISTPATLTVTGPDQPASEGNTHGGGGAPSAWFLALLAIAGLARRFLGSRR